MVTITIAHSQGVVGTFLVDVDVTEVKMERGIPVARTKAADGIPCFVLDVGEARSWGVEDRGNVYVQGTVLGSQILTGEDTIVPVPPSRTESGVATAKNALAHYYKRDAVEHKII